MKCLQSFKFFSFNICFVDSVFLFYFRSVLLFLHNWQNSNFRGRQCNGNSKWSPTEVDVSSANCHRARSQHERAVLFLRRRFSFFTHSLQLWSGQIPRQLFRYVTAGSKRVENKKFTCQVARQQQPEPRPSNRTVILQISYGQLSKRDCLLQIQPTKSENSFTGAQSLICFCWTGSPEFSVTLVSFVFYMLCSEFFTSNSTQYYYHFLK